MAPIHTTSFDPRRDPDPTIGVSPQNKTSLDASCLTLPMFSVTRYGHYFLSYGMELYHPPHQTKIFRQLSSNICKNYGQQHSEKNYQHAIHGFSVTKAVGVLPVSLASGGGWGGERSKP